MILLNPLFLTMKESKCRQEQLFYEEKCSVQLLGVCSACFLKLGHMLLWMVGFKWEKNRCCQLRYPNNVISKCNKDA